MKELRFMQDAGNPRGWGGFGITRDAALFVAGLIPLAYVVYAGFFDLPPILNNLVVFTAIFLGLSAVLNWRGKFSLPLLLFIFFGLFFLPLTWLWRGLEFDDNVLMGIFPFNDGMNYLVDAYRLLSGLDTMILYNGRPIFPGYLAFLMRLFDGNLQIALALLCAGAALSIFFLAVEVREVSGPLAAGMTSAILFYFSLQFLGRVNTENLGIILGALALALLLRGARAENLAVLAFGAFTLSLALNARPGALFALPLLIVWAWVNRKTYGAKSLFILAGAMSVGFLINSYHTRSFALSDKDAFSNFGHSLYGLAAGYKGWGYIYSVHPDLSNTSNVLPLALELIREKPHLLLMGLWLNYKDYLSPGTMFPLMNFNDQQIWIGWILYALTALGLFQLIRPRRAPAWSLVLFLVAGIFLSMAAVPYNDTGFRVLMATNPVNALLAGLAFMGIEKRRKEEGGGIPVLIPLLFAGILGVTITAAPFVTAAFPRAFPTLPVMDCPEGMEQISVEVTPGSYINIVRDGPAFGFLPEVKKSDIKARLDDYYIQGNVPYDTLTAFPALERLVKNLKPGETILIGLNLTELNAGSGPDKFIFLVTQTNRIQQLGGVNHFCAVLAAEDRLRSNRFYYDRSVLDNE